MKMLSFIQIVFLAIVIWCSLVATTAAESGILGKWSGNGSCVWNGATTKSVEFLENGTAIIAMPDERAFPWSQIDDKRISVTGPWGSVIFTFSIEGNSLNLTYDGVPCTFIRA